MNVLQVNGLYSCGGAETIARELYLYFDKKEGINSYFISGFKSKNDIDNVNIIYESYLLRVLNRLMTNNHKRTPKSMPFTVMYLKRFIRKNNVDVVHFHNTHGNYLGIKDVKEISKVVPVVWTLHDSWALTGHCASPFECGQWMSCCKNCEHLDYYFATPKKSWVKQEFKWKNEYYPNNGITFVTPSAWLMKQAKTRMLPNEKFFIVNNGIRTDEFLILDKIESRKKLGLPTDKKIIGVIATNLNTPQKGFHLLVDALLKIENIDKYHLVFVGDGEGLSEKLPCTYTSLGTIIDKEKLNQFYSSLDLLVNPTLMESFGLVNVEAMASGTPVLVFDVGPLKEIVDEKAGWIVERIDSDSLSSAISAAFVNQAILKEKADNAPKIAQEYSIDKMAESYLKIYEGLI